MKYSRTDRTIAKDKIVSVPPLNRFSMQSSYQEAFLRIYKVYNETWAQLFASGFINLNMPVRDNSAHGHIQRRLYKTVKTPVCVIERINVPFRYRTSFSIIDAEA